MVIHRKTNRRETKKYYTTGLLNYKDNAMFTMDYVRLREIVENVLTKVPMEIVDRLYDEALILTITTQDKGVYYPSTHLKDKHIILIAESQLDAEDIEHTILHEVAHFHLNHKQPMFEDDFTEEDGDRQEEEAEQQVKKWLQEFEEYSASLANK
jgi:hypothetical protein